MGYNFSNYINNTFFSNNDGLWINNITCNGSENSLYECNFSGIYIYKFSKILYKLNLNKRY